MNLSRQAMMALALAGFSMGGCGSGIHYEHATVHGKVTYQGKPVPLGSVLFVPVEPPADGVMQPASGTIKSDGTYELKSQADAGAILGEHKVVVMAIEGGPSGPEASKNDTKAAKDANTPSAPTAKSVKFKSLIPKKYSDPTTTPLTRKVVAGDNTIDLEITD